MVYRGTHAGRRGEILSARSDQEEKEWRRDEFGSIEFVMRCDVMDGNGYNIIFQNGMTLRVSISADNLTFKIDSIT